MPDPSPSTAIAHPPTTPRGQSSDVRDPTPNSHLPSATPISAFSLQLSAFFRSVFRGPSPISHLPSATPISAFSLQLSAFFRSVRSQWSALLPLLLFSVLWLDLIRQLSYQWSTNEQYAYGWFVPLLALGLFWKKWASRPRARSPVPPWAANPVIQLPEEPVPMPWTYGLPIPWSGGLAISWSFLVFLLVGLLALLLLPIRVVHEINQDWPLFSWPLALIVVAITLFALFLAGGLRWVGHFAFPALFILVAVQWPYRIEHGVTQGLMQAVVAITVKVLGSFDVMALQRGNVIELSTGVVGIDEACAGIRSFQSTLMGALFLGELYRFTVSQRCRLLVGGVVVSFCLNIVRTLLLTWYASDAGIAAIKKLHDPAGFSIFILSFACLWLMAWRIQRNAAAKALAEETEDLGYPATPESEAPALPPRAPIPSSIFNLASSAPRRFLLVFGCWSVFVFFANEAWYRLRAPVRGEPIHWWLTYPTNRPSFRELPVPESARKLLKYDQGVAGAWEEPDGTQWTAYCFRWRAGDPTARMSALGHRPEYCLTGSGHQLEADLGTRLLLVNGLEMPFRAYIFDDSRQRLHVFFCLWEDGAERQSGFGESKYLDRLRSVWSGRRGLGQQTMEVAINGYATEAEAERVLRERLPGWIQIQATRSEKSPSPG